MAIYSYKAREFSGKTIIGTLEVENEEALLERLHRRNAVPLSIKRIDEPEKKNPVFEKIKISIKRFFSSIKAKDILMFTYQLSAMFSSGIPLSKSLQSISVDTKNKRFQEVITEVYRSIEAGEDLSQAMSHYPEVFDEIYVSLINSGEISGTLAIILPQLVSYLERNMEVKGKVKAAITYPIIIICFALFIISILVIAIVPKFSNIYVRLKAPLPLPTQILLKGSELIRDNILVVILAVLSILIIFFLSLQTEKMALLWDKLKLKFPIYGNLLTQSIFAKFNKTLSILLQSGMPIIKSLQIGANSIGNRYVQQILDKCTINIQKGDSISQAFSNSKAFPDLLVQMISSGEESGTLHLMLDKTANFYQQQVNNSIATLTSLIEPILIIFIGLVIAFIAISIFLPIFRIGAAL